MRQNSLLENWRKSAHRRAEFAAMLEEPAMKDAIQIIKEVIFHPLNPPAGLTPTDRLSWFGEMGLRREAYLEMLNNFLSLADLSPVKTNAQELQKKKPWDTIDEEAGKNKILHEFYSGNPPPLEGLTGSQGPDDSGAAGIGPEPHQ